MHNGYINIVNEKMSKSLVNFVLVNEIIQKHDPNALRFFMLSVHYRHPINYSEELLNNAKQALERLQTTYQNLSHRLEASTDLTEDDDQWLEKIQKHHEQFIQVMDDDFNTANAITVLFELSKTANYYLMEKTTSSKVIKKFLEEFEQLFDVLGLKLTTNEAELLDEEIEQLIAKRNEARKNRDFKTADEIRDQLKEMKIILEDTPQGTRWKRG